MITQAILSSQPIPIREVPVPPTAQLVIQAANEARDAAIEAQTAAENAQESAETSANSASTSATNAANSANSASTSATNADNSADNAATSATNASSSEIAALAAQTAAQTARDSAFTNANVYADTTAGLAATTNTQQFTVVVGMFLNRYRNDSGTATLIASTPNSVAALQEYRYSKSGRLDAMTFYPTLTARQTQGGTLTPFTYSATGGLTVAVASAGNSRIYSLTTPLYVENGQMNVELTAVCGTIPATRTPSFGIAFGAAGTVCRHYLWLSSGVITIATDAESFTNLVAANATTAFVAGDTLKLCISSKTATSTAILTAYKNGTLVATVALSSVPSGVVSFSFRGEGTFTLPTVYTDGISQSALDAIAVAATPELDTTKRTNLAVLERMLSKLELPLPSNWTGQTFPVKVYEIASGVFVTDYDQDLSLPFALNAATSTYYVDVGTGSDGNTGTALAPFKTLYKAIHGGSGNVLVYVKSGLYDKDNGFKDANPTCTNLIIKRWDTSGRIISSMQHTGLVWTVVPSYSNTYSTTITSCKTVVDNAVLTAKGNGTVLTLKASIADVNGDVGSYYVDGTTLYVHTANSRAPDSDVWAMEDKRNFKFNVAAGTLWMEHIDFRSGTRAAQISHTLNAASWAKCYAHNCTFKYAANTRNGFSTDGAVTSILYQCGADENEKDGFNYHSYLTSSPPLAVEIECTGYTNGHDGATINNASTMHDGGSVLRVDCDYVGSEGRVVHDINSSHSWNVGCHAGASYATVVSPVANVCWAAGFDSGDATKMYLYKCTGSDSTYSRQTLASAVIYAKDYEDLDETGDVSGSDIRAYV